MTISEIIRSTANTLREHSDAPQLDADRIVLHVLDQREPSYLIVHSSDTISSHDVQEITRMADQRKTSMPLAYILGAVDFYERTFIVTPSVLIPRPDTEILIEKALEYIKNNFPEKKEITIADICTGSGIIAITLALELEKLTKALPASRQVQANETVRYRFIATDISPAALAIAKENAKQHKVLEKIEFIQGDMFGPFDFDQGKPHKIDLIVSNPPYIPTSELDAIYCVQKPNPHNSKETPWNEGLLFEPRIALDGGPDGQKFVDQIKKSGIPAIIETTGGEIIEV